MLGKLMEYRPACLTKGKAAYIVSNSPDTPIGYSTMNSVYLKQNKMLITKARSQLVERCTPTLLIGTGLLESIGLFIHFLVHPLLKIRFHKPVF